MNVLGLNAYHGDSAACLVIDGRLVAAAEEERFRRVKHWAGFPSQAIAWCLAEAGLAVTDIEHVAINRDPKAHLLDKALFAFAKRPSLKAVRDRLGNAGRVRGVAEALAAAHDIDPARLRATVHNVEHHRAHLASAFLVSPFERAAVASIDGFGDFVSTMWGVGEGTAIRSFDQVMFPHSLGLFYLAATQFLGFDRYGDEYKVMGLAPYGEPAYLDALRRIVRLENGGRFSLGLDYFLHHSEGVAMVWDDGEPRIGRVFSPKWADLLGPPREPDAPLDQRHRDLAASLQALFEQAFFHVLDALAARADTDALCLSGGCAYNSVANGKVLPRGPFKRLYVQSAAGDAGGAVGAAFDVWHRVSGRPRDFRMDHAYWGPAFDEPALAAAIARHERAFADQGCRTARLDDQPLCERVAAAIAEGKVIGWFQGRMEWGPRALGNRSILADPRRADMKDILNLKIKRRESFRPFAPSILRDAVADWFETDDDVPFMLQVYQIRAERRAEIPAVTHVNGSGRLQTVTVDQNPLYHRLIAAFGRLTGVPILLNTSFNENEPIVCRPEEAIDCFLRTRMDMLVLGPFVIER